MAQASLVDAVGTARRLQALACAGYGLGEIAKMLGSRRLTVQSWRRQRHRLVRMETRVIVGDLYDRLWCTDGPSQSARIYADRNGWLPFEAWTDELIDDPTAVAYQEAHLSIDWVLLDLVKTRHRQFMVLNDAERLYLYRACVARGMTPRGFRDRYRPVPAPVLRWLQEHA